MVFVADFVADLLPEALSIDFKAISCVQHPYDDRAPLAGPVCFALPDRDSIMTRSRLDQ
jgi:hypothetical protein